MKTNCDTVIVNRRLTEEEEDAIHSLGGVANNARNQSIIDYTLFRAVIEHAYSDKPGNLQ